MDIVVAPRVTRYLEHLASHPDPILAEMREAADARGIPDVGPMVGRLLEQFARLTNAKRVVEIPDRLVVQIFRQNRA